MKLILIRVVNLPAILFAGFWFGIHYTRHFYSWDESAKRPFWQWTGWKKTISDAWTGNTWKKLS